MFWRKEDSLKFIATIELGRLCKWMRLLGYDTAYFDSREKRELIIKSLREDRVILTRDAVMSRYTGTRMIRITHDFVKDQLKEVLKQTRIKIDENKIFTRCTLCNSPIERVEKSDIENRIPPYVKKTQDLFLKCTACDKVYWKGTHWKLATDFLRGRAEA